MSVFIFDIFGVVLLSKQIETEGRDQVTPPLHFISLEKFRKHFHRLYTKLLCEKSC